MTTTEVVKSETILREVRARILALVKEPPQQSVARTGWEIELMALLKVEVIYSQPKIIPLVDHTGDERFQVRP